MTQLANAGNKSLSLLAKKSGALKLAYFSTPNKPSYFIEKNHYIETFGGLL